MEPVRSAHKATTDEFFFPSSWRPTPKPERVSFFSVNVYFISAKIWLALIADSETIPGAFRDKRCRESRKYIPNRQQLAANSLDDPEKIRIFVAIRRTFLHPHASHHQVAGLPRSRRDGGVRSGTGRCHQPLTA